MEITAKERAASAALELVQDGMVLGLGTGSTAKYFIDGIGAKVAQGWDLKCIPTSQPSADQAMQLGIPLIEPDETTIVDLDVDGADEVDPQGCLIKGGGGALLREKIIAQTARQFVVIADESKDVATLGAFPLPVEMDRFGWALTVKAIREVLSDLGYGHPNMTLRPLEEGGFFLSDGGHYVLDVSLGQIQDPVVLDKTLTQLAGVVTTGIFAGLADKVILGTSDGVRISDF
ncbi:MAG: ribose-5-phosphate isomerase RpiA [Pseudomonadota bacterium]